jgi:hypothetical protein
VVRDVLMDFLLSVRLIPRMEMQVFQVLYCIFKYTGWILTDRSVQYLSIKNVFESCLNKVESINE